jgi:predicted nuclease of restriction endonuclease-like (RecB) superfamily
MNKPTINFVQDIKDIVRKARYNVVRTINSEMLTAYYEIGKRIVEEEQKGSSRAEYGKKLIETLSRELVMEFGKGYGTTALRDMRKFYVMYKDKIHRSVTGELYKLSWTHYCELMKIEDETKRNYFEKYAIDEGLSVRDLKRQMYSLHYERLLMSKNKQALLEYEKRGNKPDKSEDVVKDPYVLEFLGMDEKAEYSEKEVESRVLDSLQKFLLELGQGFTFVARQKRFTIDNDHFYIDLLFYNVRLRSYIIVDLKTGKFKHDYAGQMNFYLNYVKKELNCEGDADPIGIILCTEKDNVKVEYATSGISNKIFVSKYQFYLPSKEELEKRVRRAL